MYPMLEHPEISHCERTGYPSWIHDWEEDGDEDDSLYDDDEGELDDGE